MNPPQTPFWLLAFFLLAFAGTACGAPKPPPTADTVLILYDSAGQYGWGGEGHARLLANLLGHFPCAYQLAPAETYAAGGLSRYKAGLYMGSGYDNPLRAAFLADGRATSNPVCWV